MAISEPCEIRGLARFKFPGTYGLLLYLPARKKVTVGRLGTQVFKRGWYIYVGSAQGPGGVAARAGHHLRRQHQPRWHLDYLRLWTRARVLWAAPRAREHQWATVLTDLPSARRPMAGFGASDCRCPSHLIYYPHRPAWKAITISLQAAFPHDPPPIMITLGSDS